MAKNNSESRKFFIPRLAALSEIDVFCVLIANIVSDGSFQGTDIYLFVTCIGFVVLGLVFLVSPNINVDPNGIAFQFQGRFEWSDFRKIVYFNRRSLASIEFVLEEAAVDRMKSRGWRFFLRGLGSRIEVAGWSGIDLEALKDAVGMFYDIEEVY